MTLPELSDYLDLRSNFAVSGDLARSALAGAQPLAMEALGIHTQRQTLVEGELPAYIVTTTPETNGGWGELMSVWFKPYERPVPLYCLDNWALFALLYRSAFGAERDDVRRGLAPASLAPASLAPASLAPASLAPARRSYESLATAVGEAAFNVETLARVVIGADLLIPFLPGTDGAGRFLRHGVLPILLAILWLAPADRDAWLSLHERGARRFAAEHNLKQIENLSDWLERVENEALLIPERELVAGESAVSAFLADATRAPQYAALFGGLCLSVTALADALGTDWRKWVFQAVNVGYRTPDFGLAQIAGWLNETSGR